MAANLSAKQIVFSLFRVFSVSAYCSGIIHGSMPSAPASRGLQGIRIRARLVWTTKQSSTKASPDPGAAAGWQVQRGHAHGWEPCPGIYYRHIHLEGDKIFQRAARRAEQRTILVCDPGLLDFSWPELADWPRSANGKETTTSSNDLSGSRVGMNCGAPVVSGYQWPMPRQQVLPIILASGLRRMNENISASTPLSAKYLLVRPRTSVAIRFAGWALRWHYGASAGHGQHPAAKGRASNSWPELEDPAMRTTSSACPLFTAASLFLL